MEKIKVKESPLATWASSWDPITGSSWYYYVNSGDYKIEQVGDNLRINILAAGLTIEDIEAFIEDNVLIVKTIKPGWNGAVQVSIDLSAYRFNTKSPESKLANGVLTIEFPPIEKNKLEIQIN